MKLIPHNQIGRDPRLCKLRRDTSVARDFGAFVHSARQEGGQAVKGAAGRFDKTVVAIPAHINYRSSTTNVSFPSFYFAENDRGCGCRQRIAL